MRSTLFQPWITLSGTGLSQVQDVESWLPVDDFVDATFWIDVLNVASATTLSLNLETAPTEDESLFAAVAPAVTLAVTGVPLVTKTLRCATTVPLASWLRWRITAASGVAWSVTFRIRVVASRTRYLVPPDLAGCSLWLRSDLGVTVVSGTASAWSDQSGLGNSATAGSTAPTYDATGGVFGYPRLRGSGAAFMTGGLANPYVVNHTFFAVVAYPSTLTYGAAGAGTYGPYTTNSGFAQFTEAVTGIRARAGASSSTYVTTSTLDLTSLGAPGIYSTAADSNSVDLYINGSFESSTATGFGLASCTNYALMALDNVPTYPLNGDAYEYIIFNRVLAPTERTMVHRYLGGRYGIAVR